MTRWSNFQGIKRRFSHLIGASAEDKACRYLLEQGLVLIERNYRCRGGEIDLIMSDNEQLIFVEVKYRKQNQYGYAAEYFTEQKRKTVQRAILHYLKDARLNHATTAMRIDLVAIDDNQIQWLKAV